MCAVRIDFIAVCCIPDKEMEIAGRKKQAIMDRFFSEFHDKLIQRIVFVHTHLVVFEAVFPFLQGDLAGVEQVKHVAV